MARNYVALPYEYLEEMDSLTDEEFGHLCRGLLRYSMEGTPIPPEGNLKFFARRVMRREDRFQESFEEQRQKHADAGKKGAEVRWGRHGKAMATDSNAIFANGTIMATNGKNGNTEADTDTDTKADTDFLPTTVGEKRGPTAAPAPAGAVRPTREQVSDYIRERGLNVDGERFWSYYEARNWQTQNGRPVDWRKRAAKWAKTERGPAGRTSAAEKTAEQRRAENESSIDEMRRALERMKEECDDG